MSSYFFNTMMDSDVWPQWLLVILTCTFALVRTLWEVWVGGSINSDSPVRDPGLVNTSFHPLHDEIQQDVNCLADVLSVCSTCLKVWDSAWRENIGYKHRTTDCCYQLESNRNWTWFRGKKGHLIFWGSLKNICFFGKGVSSRIFYMYEQIFAFPGGPI